MVPEAGWRDHAIIISHDRIRFPAGTRNQRQTRHTCRDGFVHKVRFDEATGWPAFAQYRPSPEGGHKAWALIILELSGDRISGVNSFLD
jgi:hypothetical protein